MATFRLSLFYLSSDDEGWSENYYWTGTDLTSAQSELTNLINYRKAMLSSNFKIVNARASDVAVRGSVIFTTTPTPIIGTYSPPTGAKPLEANTAIVQRFNATSPRYAKIYLRGLTSAQVSGREKQAESVWDAAWATWKTAIEGGAFQARHRLGTAPPFTYSYSSITNDGGYIVSARKPGRPFDLLVGRRTKPG